MAVLPGRDQPPEGTVIEGIHTTKAPHAVERDVGRDDGGDAVGEARPGMHSVGRTELRSPQGKGQAEGVVRHGQERGEDHVSFAFKPKAMMHGKINVT
jgi:hypothetical protein